MSNWVFLFIFVGPDVWSREVTKRRLRLKKCSHEKTPEFKIEDELKINDFSPFPGHMR